MKIYMTELSSIKKLIESRNFDDFYLGVYLYKQSGKTFYEFLDFIVHTKRNLLVCPLIKSNIWPGSMYSLANEWGIDKEDDKNWGFTKEHLIIWENV